MTRRTAKKWNDGWQRAKAERDAPIIVNIVAAICVILIIGVLLLLWWRRRRKGRESNEVGE